MDCFQLLYMLVSLKLDHFLALQFFFDPSFTHNTTKHTTKVLMFSGAIKGLITSVLFLYAEVKPSPVSLNLISHSFAE